MYTFIFTNIYLYFKKYNIFNIYYFNNNNNNNNNLNDHWNVNLRDFIDHYYIIIFVGIDRSVLIFDYFSPLIVPTSVKKKNNIKRRMKFFFSAKVHEW